MRKPFGLFLEATERQCPDCQGCGIANMEFAADGSLYGADPCYPCDGTGRRLVFTSERKAENSNPTPARVPCA